MSRFENSNFNQLGILSNTGVNIENYPIITPENDDTARFQRALDALNTKGGGVLQLSNKTYNVITGSLTLHSNCAIMGVMGSIIRTYSTSGNILAGSSVSNVIIEKITFIAPNSSVTAVSVLTSSNITVKECMSTNCALFSSGTTVTSYVNVTSDSQLSSHIRVSDNICTSDGSNNKNACITIAYSRDVTITNNKLFSYTHGIQWWGGDSNTSQNGALTNTRWAKNIEITGNVIDGMGMGGIWGSMGAFVNVTGNTVLNCGDVGIDFEGCFYCTASGNNVQNCANGCLTTFYLNKGITFTGNSVTSTVAGQWLLKIYNAAQISNKSITIIGNIFEGQGVICNIGSGGGDQCEKILFEGNTCVNTILNFTANNNKYTDVKDNQLIFDVSAASAINAISLAGNNGNGIANVKGNTITTSVTQPSGSIGINITQSDYNSSCKSIIESNVIDGFPVDIQTAGNSGNVGIYPDFVIKSNVMTSRNYVRADTNNSYVKLIDNTDHTGKPYPSAIPTTGKWDVGQRIYLDPPAAAGKIGAVCVTAGTPGTWKNYGVVDA